MLNLQKMSFDPIFKNNGLLPHIFVLPSRKTILSFSTGRFMNAELGENKEVLIL